MEFVKGISKEEIKSKIKKFIIDNFLFGDESKKIKDTDSFMENGIIDSTGILELIQHIEENSSIKIKDDELLPENLDSLNNISAFIVKKLG